MEKRYPLTIKPIAIVFEFRLFVRSTLVLLLLFIFLFGYPLYTLNKMAYSNVIRMISESNAAQQVYTAMTQAAQSNVPIPDQSSTPLIETSTSTSGLVPSDTKNARISCVNIEEVNLRVSPGYINKTDNDSIVHVPCGEDVTIINGPSQADGLDWWYVRWNGYQGWMADHTGSGTQILIISP